MNNNISNKPKFISKLKTIYKTTQNIKVNFINFFKGKKINKELFHELEERLLLSDVGLEVTEKLMNKLTKNINYKDSNNTEFICNKIREEMLYIFSNIENKHKILNNSLPHVILVVGINGVGKTTTISKLAYNYKKQGKSVILVAGDTFRAAAIEQLQILGDNINIPVIAQHIGTDPASVIFDAIKSAQSKKYDILIADTAGRLQNKINLIEELKKIVRVMHKINKNFPHEIILILDASTGQNAINQTKIFNEALGISSIILTKLDGTAKGGIILNIINKFKIPINYIGTGKNINDLKIFDANKFIQSLLI